MHRRLFLTVFALAPGLVSAASRLRVVATFSILADMARQVGADLVTTTALVPPDGDAHTYQPRASDLRMLQTAGVVVENGLGLEGWMDRLTGATAFGGTRVVATKGIVPRRIANGTGAAAIDPHAWQDPRNGAIYVRNIAAGLIAADPANADAYRAAADRYTQQIEQTDAWISARFAPIPAAERRIITTHDAFGYYGARFGIEFLSAEGLSTEGEPSARAIAALIAQIKREHIHAVFIENMTDPRMAQMIARETGARLGGTVYSDALSPPGGPAATYLQMFRHNTTLFAQAMRPA